MFFHIFTLCVIFVISGATTERPSINRHKKAGKSKTLINKIAFKKGSYFRPIPGMQPEDLFLLGLNQIADDTSMRSNYKGQKHPVVSRGGFMKKRPKKEHDFPFIGQERNWNLNGRRTTTLSNPMYLLWHSSFWPQLQDDYNILNEILKNLVNDTTVQPQWNPKTQVGDIRPSPLLSALRGYSKDDSANNAANRIDFQISMQTNDRSPGDQRRDGHHSRARVVETGSRRVTGPHLLRGTQTGNKLNRILTRLHENGNDHEKRTIYPTNGGLDNNRAIGDNFITFYDMNDNRKGNRQHIYKKNNKHSHDNDNDENDETKSKSKVGDDDKNVVIIDSDEGNFNDVEKPMIIEPKMDHLSVTDIEYTENGKPLHHKEYTNDKIGELLNDHANDGNKLLKIMSTTSSPVIQKTEIHENGAKSLVDREITPSKYDSIDIERSDIKTQENTFQPEVTDSRDLESSSNHDMSKDIIIDFDDSKHVEIQNGGENINNRFGIKVNGRNDRTKPIKETFASLFLHHHRPPTVKHENVEDHDGDIRRFQINADGDDRRDREKSFIQRNDRKKNKPDLFRNDGDKTRQQKSFKVGHRNNEDPPIKGLPVGDVKFLPFVDFDMDEEIKPDDDKKEGADGMFQSTSRDPPVTNMLSVLARQQGVNSMVTHANVGVNNVIDTKRDDNGDNNIDDDNQINGDNNLEKDTGLKNQIGSSVVNGLDVDNEDNTDNNRNDRDNDGGDILNKKMKAKRIVYEVKNGNSNKLLTNEVVRANNGFGNNMISKNNVDINHIKVVDGHDVNDNVPHDKNSNNNNNNNTNSNKKNNNKSTNNVDGDDDNDNKNIDPILSNQRKTSDRIQIVKTKILEKISKNNQIHTEEGKDGREEEKDGKESDNERRTVFVMNKDVIKNDNIPDLSGREKSAGKIKATKIEDANRPPMSSRPRADNYPSKKRGLVTKRAAGFNEESYLPVDGVNVMQTVRNRLPRSLKSEVNSVNSRHDENNESKNRKSEAEKDGGINAVNKGNERDVEKERISRTLHDSKKVDEKDIIGKNGKEIHEVRSYLEKNSDVSDGTRGRSKKINGHDKNNKKESIDKDNNMENKNMDEGKSKSNMADDDRETWLGILTLDTALKHDSNKKNQSKDSHSTHHKDIKEHRRHVFHHAALGLVLLAVLVCLVVSVACLGSCASNQGMQRAGSRTALYRPHTFYAYSSTEQTNPQPSGNDNNNIINGAKFAHDNYAYF